MEAMDVVIETPKGSAQKFNYDPESNFFRLKKVLPMGMVFPYDFGFIPGTKGEDGDPLDILIISEFPSFPGCIISCKIIGGIKAEQKERNEKTSIRNDRFMAIPETSLMFREITEVKDLPGKIIEELKAFFVNYNEIAGKLFKPTGIINARTAFRMVKENKDKNRG